MADLLTQGIKLLHDRNLSLMKLFIRTSIFAKYLHDTVLLARPARDINLYSKEVGSLQSVDGCTMGELLVWNERRQAVMPFFLRK